MLPAADYRDDWYGEKGRAWYKFVRNSDGEPEDFPETDSLAGTKKRLDSLVNKEVTRVGSKNVFLGGSSQGCAAAFHCFASSSDTLGGFLGVRGTFLEETPASRGDTDRPVLVFYGELDDVIPPESTLTQAKRFRDLYDIETICVPDVGHDFGNEEIGCIDTFLRAVTS